MTIDIVKQTHSDKSAFKLIVADGDSSEDEGTKRVTSPKQTKKETIDTSKNGKKQTKDQSKVDKDAQKSQHKRAASINLPEKSSDGATDKRTEQMQQHRRAASDSRLGAKKKSHKREALEDLLGTLADQCETLGEAHPKTGSTYNQLGTYYFRHGDYDAAESSYAEALKCYQAAYEVGKEKNKEYCKTTGAHQIAVLLNNISTVKWRRGYLSEATAYIQQSLDIQEGLLARKSDTMLIDPVEVGGTYYNLGIVYSLQGSHKMSLKAFKDAKEKYQQGEALYGPLLLEKARVIDAIGKTYLLAGNSSKAIKYIQEAIRMKKGVLDKKHPSVLRSLSSLADVHKMQGEFGRAEYLLLKVLRAQETSFNQSTSKDDWDIIAQDILETKRALADLYNCCCEANLDQPQLQL